MKLFTLLIISLLPYVLTVLELLEDNLVRDQRLILLSDFTYKIVKQFCKLCNAILIVHVPFEETSEIFFETKFTTSLYTILVDGNGTSIEDNPLNITYNGYIPDLTIFFLDTESCSIESMIFSIELSWNWNIRGMFLVVVNGDKDEIDFEEFFTSFWERQALRVVMVFNIEDKIQMVTFDPFKKDYNIELSWEDLDTNWLKRLVTNMVGTTIKLYQFDLVLTDAAVKKVSPNGEETWVGPDGMFFSVYAKSMNTTLEVHRISDDFDDDMIKNADPSLPFSQYFNLFSEMYDFDILFNRMQTFSDNNLDHIFLYERNDWRIIVPKTGLVPQYLYVVLLVKGDVWAATLVSLLGMILLRKIIGRESSAPTLDNLAYLLGKYFIISNIFLKYHLLGTSAPHRRGMRTLEKIILGLWAINCVVIGTMFQTSLMSALIVPKYYPNMDSLQQLYISGLNVYGAEYTNIQIKRILASQNEQLLINQLRNVPRDITIYGDNIEWIDHYK